MLLIPQAQLHAQLQIADVQSLQRRDRAFKVSQLDTAMRIVKNHVPTTPTVHVALAARYSARPVGVFG